MPASIPQQTCNVLQHRIADLRSTWDILALPGYSRRKQTLYCTKAWSWWNDVNIALRIRNWRYHSTANNPHSVTPLRCYQCENMFFKHIPMFPFSMFLISGRSRQSVGANIASMPFSSSLRLTAKLVKLYILKANCRQNTRYFGKAAIGFLYWMDTTKLLREITESNPIPSATLKARQVHSKLTFFKEEGGAVWRSQQSLLQKIETYFLYIWY